VSSSVRARSASRTRCSSRDAAEVTGPLAHLLQRAAAIAQHVDQRHALGVEQLEGKPHPLGRVLDTGEGIRNISEQILAPTQIAALVAQRDTQLGTSVLGLAGGLRRLGRAPGEALQRHIQGLLLDTRRLGGDAQLLQRLAPRADLVGGLANGICRRDRAVDQRSAAAHRRSPDQRAPKSADAGAQQLRLGGPAPAARPMSARLRSQCGSGSACRSGRSRPARP
jgi:hypothetical protein